MAVTLRWTWYCLGTGRTECPETGDGIVGLNKHVAATRHGVVQRGVPVR